MPGNQLPLHNFDAVLRLIFINRVHATAQIFVLRIRYSLSVSQTMGCDAHLGR